MRIKLISLVVFMMTMSSASNSQEELKTPFRGIRLGMQKSDVASAGPSAFRYENSQDPFRGDHTSIYAGSDYCGIVFFDRNIVQKMKFFGCYFDASNMSLRELAQSIVKNYPINSMSPGVEFVDSINGRVRVDFYSGKSNKNENIKVFSENTEGTPVIGVFVIAADKGNFN